jgi:hypothetical protein
MTEIDIRFAGATNYLEAPFVPKRLRVAFKMALWPDDGLSAEGERRYQHIAEPQDGDVVAENLANLGSWEPVESLIWLSALKGALHFTHKVSAVDVGCQLGWYTALALAAGVKDVCSVDANARALEQVQRTVEMNGWSESWVGIASAWDGTGALAAASDQLMVEKLDVEGMEGAIISGLLSEHLHANRITALLFEATPSFDMNLLSGLSTLRKAGYTLHVIHPPSTPVEHFPAGGVFIEEHCQKLHGRPEDMLAAIATYNQANVVAHREDTPWG